MTVFPQARGIEDAVLTMLGEQEIEPEEVTLTGDSPGGARLDKVDRNGQTMARPSARPGAVAVAFGFSPRRSANELPWNALAETAS